MAMGFHHRGISRFPREQQIRQLSFLLQRLGPRIMQFSLHELARIP